MCSSMKRISRRQDVLWLGLILAVYCSWFKTKNDIVIVQHPWAASAAAAVTAAISTFRYDYRKTRIAAAHHPYYYHYLFHNVPKLRQQQQQHYYSTNTAASFPFLLPSYCSASSSSNDGDDAADDEDDDDGDVVIIGPSPLPLAQQHHQGGLSNEYFQALAKRSIPIHRKDRETRQLSQDVYFQSLVARCSYVQSLPVVAMVMMAVGANQSFFPPFFEAKAPYKPQQQQQQQQLSSQQFIDADSSNTTTITNSSTTPADVTAEAIVPSITDGESIPPSHNTAVEKLLFGLKDSSWKIALQDATKSPSFRRLAFFLQRELSIGAIIHPPPGDVFGAFNLCPLHLVKVVIVGQDPSPSRHQQGQHGLAFSVRRGMPPPPSLWNILVEAGVVAAVPQHHHHHHHHHHHGNLEYWARQGVLLLNTVLTVRQGQANSHFHQGWEDFTDAVMDVLNRQKQNLVFLLWGNPAQKKAQAVDEKRHTVIRTSHPSPKGAFQTTMPFMGSRCFERANEALVKVGLDPIDWNLPE